MFLVAEYKHVILYIPLRQQIKPIYGTIRKKGFHNMPERCGVLHRHIAGDEDFGVIYVIISHMTTSAVRGIWSSRRSLEMCANV